MPLLFESSVAGNQFYAYSKTSGFAVGQPLTLVADPENKYDANAIKVMHQEQQIGHVPRAITCMIHKHRKAKPDVPLKVVLSGYYPDIVKQGRFVFTVSHD